jgi:orotate phosphoribosyltransferase
MGLFQLGDIVLASGERSNFKIECDALSTGDLECIAFLLSQRVPDFGDVEGVPSGGRWLAYLMQEYITSGPLLIVDDVWTTGGSMERHRAGREAIGAVIFARRKPAEWVTPLFILNRLLSKEPV